MDHEALWKTTANQAGVVDHDQDPEAHQGVVQELVSQRLLQLAWEHLQERSCWTALALDPAAVIPDDAETARTPMIAEARPQNVAKTANEARVSQTSPERVLLFLELVRRLKVENHARM